MVVQTGAISTTLPLPIWANGYLELRGNRLKSLPGCSTPSRLGFMTSAIARDPCQVFEAGETSCRI